MGLILLQFDKIKKGIILVYSITDKTSFAHIEN